VTDSIGFGFSLLWVEIHSRCAYVKPGPEQMTRLLFITTMKANC